MGERGPAMAPLAAAAEKRGGGGAGEERWRQLDSSVNAVSFGFVATAILISMFLLMAIFERFLLREPAPAAAAATSSSSSSFLSSRDAFRRRRRPSADLEAQRRTFAAKLDFPSPEMSVYSKGVSVLMPGHDIPTFIAHPAPTPAPAPCPPERISWPSHQHNPFNTSTSDPR